MSQKVNSTKDLSRNRRAKQSLHNVQARRLITPRVDNYSDNILSPCSSVELDNICDSRENSW